jgi:uncharacterized membrane protein YjjP (DUF1212 family)
MANNQSIITQFEALDKVVKVIIFLFLGALASSVYRIIRYTETNNSTTLIIGIISLLTGGFFCILPLIDLVTEITDNRVKVLVD